MFVNDSNSNNIPFKLKTLFWLFILLAIWQTASFLLLPKARLNASDLTAQNILTAVSGERALRNLNSLNTDSRLSAAAEFKSNDMMNRRYFSHTDPEGNYIWGKITAAGYTPYLQLGENLAIEFYNTESLVSAWMNSPTHRANILNQGFKDQGMGLAFGIPEQGQYFSSIANTFGSLVPTKKKPLPPAKLPAHAPPPPPQLPAPDAPANASPAAAAKPAPTQVRSAENQSPPTTTEDKLPSLETTNPPKESLRDSEAEKNQQPFAQNYALPPEETAPVASGTENFGGAVLNLESSRQSLTSYEINRYLMLGLSAVLLVMIISDLKKMFELKLHSYDKKINNLVLLILSLIVIGLMYWL